MNNEMTPEKARDLLEALECSDGWKVYDPYMRLDNDCVESVAAHVCQTETSEDAAFIASSPDIARAYLYVSKQLAVALKALETIKQYQEMPGISFSRATETLIVVDVAIATIKGDHQ